MFIVVSSRGYLIVSNKNKGTKLCHIQTKIYRQVHFVPSPGGGEGVGRMFLGDKQNTIDFKDCSN